MKLAALLLVAFFASLDSSTASRILFLFPSPSKSHLIVVQGLSTTLAERGHDVTVVSPFPLDKPMKNYRDIKVEVPEDMLKLSTLMVTNPNGSLFKLLPRLMRNLFTMGNDMLTMPEFKKIMNEERFDLVIIGMFFNNYLLGVGDHFKCPTMMLSVSGPMTLTDALVGNPLSVSASAHPFFDVNLKTFIGRVKNFFAYGGDLLMKTTYMNYVQKQNYDLNFPSDRYISYEESQSNLSMILLNSHFSQSGPRPYVQAMIEVGGLQIKPTPDPLPEKLQTWLDGASEHGAIFFSLGSNAKTTFLPREKIDVLLKVFATLKQRVVMKWESDELVGKPGNVLISKWLPQDDILAHSNVKIFISHCGLGSVAEANYHGVPIVAMPIGIDQLTNADKVVKEGWGVQTDFSNLNENDLLLAIQQVLTQPRYAATAKKLSELYRDRPMNARDTASYWVEYVIKHRGAPHLRFPGADQNFVENNSIDVVLFLFAAIYVAFKLFKAFVKFLFSKLCSSKKSTKAKKNN